MIHTFGDSHSCFGWIEPMGGSHQVPHHTSRTVGNITAHHLGPRLAYSVGRDGVNLLNITNHGIKPGDSVVFSFGEIDCRSHVHKYVNNGGPEEVIDNIVSGYINTVLKNIDLINMPIETYLYNVVPPPDPESSVRNNPQFPFLGTSEERLNYGNIFNNKLKQASHKHQLGFIDIRALYATSSGFLNKSMSDGSVHIHTSRPLHEYLKKHNIK